MCLVNGALTRHAKYASQLMVFIFAEVNIFSALGYVLASLMYFWSSWFSNR